MSGTSVVNVRERTAPEMCNEQDTSLAVAGCQHIHVQLDEARFIGAFMTSVCRTLEVEEICSYAARALYRRAPYRRIVFAFPAESIDRTICYSPTEQNPTDISEQSSHDGEADGFDPAQSASKTTTIELCDGLGVVTIDPVTEQSYGLSETVLQQVALIVSQAIRNAVEHCRVKNLAMRDGLTGLYNRRIFDEVLTQKIQNPDTCPLSLLLVDLDNFKWVNDRFGHQAGDLALQTVARVLKDSCRGHDLVARFGGEEFAIILTQTSGYNAFAIAQRIRKRLAKTGIPCDGGEFNLTASFGLASSRSVSPMPASGIVKQADYALYQAKMTGKNKVCVYTSELLKSALASRAVGNGAPCAHAAC